jgi:isoquinoline 1-oxidoreductase alpha subunit
MVSFTLNNEKATANVDPELPLLWWLRDDRGLTGTKYGCGIGACGACTVHIDGNPMRACLTQMGTLEGKRVTTIEGLAASCGEDCAAGSLHPVQQAWIGHNVPQCGYCQAGQIMSAAALFAKNPHPDDAAIEAAMGGNLCRCGTYLRIRAALRDVAQGGGA